MTGSIQEKKGYLYTVINNPITKKQQWKSTGLKAQGNKRKAEAILRERCAECERRCRVLTKDSSFVDFMVEWLDVVKPQVKETTFYRYSLVVQNSIVPYFAKHSIRLQDLEPIHIQRYYQQKLEEGLSANTIKHHHANIHKALQYALKLNWILYNPADRVELPKVEPFRAKFYGEEELKRLLASIKGELLETPVLLAATYGLRRSEVLGLKWDAVDFIHDTLTIRRVAVPGQKKIIYSETTKTSSSYRTLSLIPPIKEHLKGVRARQALMRQSMGNAYHESDFVCTWEDGRLILPDYVSRNFPKFLKKHDLPPIRFHDLRHSSASLLVAKSHSLPEIGKWLGHSDINSTNRYAHLQHQATISMANEISKILFGESEG